MNYYSKLVLFFPMLFMSFLAQAESGTSTPPEATTSTSEAADSDFPGRKLYAHVPYITLTQLQQEYDQAVIVDARSPFEFETLRIKSAINIPLSLNNGDYEAKLVSLRNANPDKKIVFYCNGHTCMKSYKATHRAKVVARLDNVYAFDAGIFDWTKANPDKAELLGQSPVDPAKLISKSKLKQHTLSAEEFINKASDDAIILDVRSRHQRQSFYVFSRFEESISLEDRELIKGYVAQARRENKNLFIYDEVGKQVRWLQYFLEMQDPGPYYFMKGGAAAFFDLPENQFMGQAPTSSARKDL